ncbi:hypothetical protein FO519_005415 [Halicephalobus sp. NKZ332]|nr:hypothetical protein FO519_005415 [Halicephalobus sp. NKZ332]
MDKQPIVVEMKDAEIQCRPTGLCLLAIIMSSIVCWNPAMIVLVDIASSPLYSNQVNQPIESINFNDPSLSISDRRIQYSTSQKSVLFAAIFAGAISGVVPVSLLLQKLGTYKTMIGVGLISIITTAITPFAAITNFYFLVVVRFIQGTTLSNPFPVIGSITNKWSSLKESGFFVSVLTGFIQLSAIFTMPVSGVIASNVGWDVVFYVHAGVCGIVLALWAYNFSDEPHRHPFVSDKEFRKISVGKAPKVSKYNPPYKKIFKTPVIWGIYIATAVNFLFAQFAITFMPMYLVYVAKMNLSLASVLSAIPLILQFFFKCLAGTLSDKITFISDLCKIRMFNTIAFWGSGVLLIVCALVPNTNQIVTTIIVIAAVSLLGFNAGGFTKCSVIVSRQFSPTVMAVMQVIMCLSLFSGSFMVPGLTHNGTKEQYNIVFFIYAACLFVGNIVFCLLAKGEAAEWTKPVVEENKTFRNTFVLTPESLGPTEDPKAAYENNAFTTVSELPDSTVNPTVSQGESIFETIPIDVEEAPELSENRTAPQKPDREQVDNV